MVLGAVGVGCFFLPSFASAGAAAGCVSAVDSVIVVGSWGEGGGGVFGSCGDGGGGVVGSCGEGRGVAVKEEVVSLAVAVSG